MAWSNPAFQLITGSSDFDVIESADSEPEEKEEDGVALPHPVNRRDPAMAHSHKTLFFIPLFSRYPIIRMIRLVPRGFFHDSSIRIVT